MLMVYKRTYVVLTSGQCRVNGMLTYYNQAHAGTFFCGDTCDCSHCEPLTGSVNMVLDKVRSVLHINKQIQREDVYSWQYSFSYIYFLVISTRFSKVISEVCFGMFYLLWFLQLTDIISKLKRRQIMLFPSIFTQTKSIIIINSTFSMSF